MRSVSAIMLSLVLVMSSGCFTFCVEGDGELRTDSAHGTEVVHGSLYGFTWATRDVEKCSSDLGIYRVEYHTNVLFLIASIGTVGLYVPVSVEWWCQAPPSDDDGPLLGPGDDEG